MSSGSGRYGGTYAHKDIAFEFASWISVEFKLYLIKEFQRLKDEERKQLGWDIRLRWKNNSTDGRKPHCMKYLSQDRFPAGGLLSRRK